MAKKSFTVDDLKKHHFWLIAGGAVLICLGCWFVATSKLKKDAKKHMSDITSTFDKANVILRKADHPNQTTHDKMDEEWTKHRDATAKAWQDQFDAQKKQLIWIPKLENYTQNMLPVEKKIEYPPSDQIARPVRIAAKRYIVEYLPSLADIIGAKWKPGGEQDDSEGVSGAAGAGAGPTGGSSGATPEDDGSLVAWANSDQKKFELRYAWEKATPSTLEILYAQEDIWVLRALLEAIKRTNGSATGRSDAIIRELMAVDIAEEVQGMLVVGQVLNEKGGGGPIGSGGGGAGGGDDDMAGMMEAMGAGGEAPEDEGDGEEAAAVSRDPAENRYVDNNGTPVTAVRLHGAYTSKASDDAFLAVAKRIPIRFRVKMDFHKIPTLMAECGNSALPIWIRQVRVNTAKGTSSGATGGGGMMSSLSGGATEPDAGGDMAAMFAGGGGRGGTARVAPESYPFQEEVELYGVVYIYNPPDNTILGVVETKGADNGEAGDTDADDAAANDQGKKAAN